MAFDGITIASIISECKEHLVGGRIYKIAQPEKDELLLTIKNKGTQFRLLMSADASLPFMYVTEYNSPSPMTAPNFCMLLRRHLQNAKIISIKQPEFERIVRIELEHLNELGDVCQKFLVIEVMGKHSNIIFLDQEDNIIDSIKRISGLVSSVREVLPGKNYFIPETQNKKNPLLVKYEEFEALICEKSMSVFKAIYTNFMGISPMVAHEICYRARIDSEFPTNSLDHSQILLLYNAFEEAMQIIKLEKFNPVIFYENDNPIEYAAIMITSYKRENCKELDSISKLLEQYYKEKNMITRIRQKSVDLRKTVQTYLERNSKKYDLQLKQLQDTEKKDTYRIYGELLTTYGYESKLGDKTIEVMNYYTNEKLIIPLDSTMTALENAKKYFEKYAKLKRTYEALSELIKDTKDEIIHLESISTALDIAQKEEDLVQIKEELIQSGYSKRKGGAKREKVLSKPFHYISSDGYHIYVGKNNLQNEELTFQFATGNDWWFHAKGIPGSHVVVKANSEELPDTTFEEAARLAAHYSKGRGQDKIEVDYTQKKNVKKPSGGKLGFVVYYTNFSMVIDTDIREIAILD